MQLRLCLGFRVTGSEDAERCATLGFGDSGGPLVCRHGSSWHHLGAVSWGEFCAADRCGEAEHFCRYLYYLYYLHRYTPGVYASTINMRQWIIDTLDNNM